MSGIHKPGHSPFSRPWAEAPAGELGPNMAQWYWRCRGNMRRRNGRCCWASGTTARSSAARMSRHKDFATLKTVSTGSWLRQSVHGRGFGKEMRAAVALYAFDWLGAEAAESEAAAWNQQSFGVSRSLGYELNGVTRAAWGGKRQEVQNVRLTPATFNRPDWRLQVAGHHATAEFLGIGT